MHIFMLNLEMTANILLGPLMSVRIDSLGCFMPTLPTITRLSFAYLATGRGVVRVVFVIVALAWESTFLL